MSGTNPRDTSPRDQSLGELFSSVSRDLSSLIRGEIALAKAEVKVEVTNAAKGGAMFGAAGVLAFLAIILLLIAAAYGLAAAGLAAGWAFLIVAGVLLLGAGVLALVGKKAFSHVGPPKRTLRTAKDTARFLKNPRSGDAPPTS